MHPPNPLYSIGNQEAPLGGRLRCSPWVPCLPPMGAERVWAWHGDLSLRFRRIAREVIPWRSSDRAGLSPECSSRLIPAACAGRALSWRQGHVYRTPTDKISRRGTRSPESPCWAILPVLSPVCPRPFWGCPPAELFNDGRPHRPRGLGFPPNPPVPRWACQPRIE